MTLHCARCDYVAASKDDLTTHAGEAGHPVCAVCRRTSLGWDEAGSCVPCLNRTRGHLNAVVDLYASLPDELLNRGGMSVEPIPTGTRDPVLPGGDTLVELAAVARVESTGDRDRRKGDRIPTIVLLASWVASWRGAMGLPVGVHRSDVVGLAAWLNQHMHWASQHHTAFAEFAGELRNKRADLEELLHAGDRPLRAPAPCFECGEWELTRWYADPKPCTHRRDDGRPCGYCDQGGLQSPDDPHAPVWICRSCGQGYSEERYLLALRAATEDGAKSL